MLLSLEDVVNIPTAFVDVLQAGELLGAHMGFYADATGLRMSEDIFDVDALKKNKP